MLQIGPEGKVFCSQLWRQFPGCIQRLYVRQFVIRVFIYIPNVKEQAQWPPPNVGAYHCDRIIAIDNDVAPSKVLRREVPYRKSKHNGVFGAMQSHTLLHLSISIHTYSLKNEFASAPKLSTFSSKQIAGRYRSSY